MGGPQKFAIVVTANGEVRDKDGNLISSEPVEARLTLTEDELRLRGLIPPEGEAS